MGNTIKVTLLLLTFMIIISPLISSQTLTYTSGTHEICYNITGYTDVVIDGSAILNICKKNDTIGTGSVVFSLGDNGNFSCYTGFINGSGRGFKGGNFSNLGTGGQSGQQGNSQNGTGLRVQHNNKAGGGGGDRDVSGGIFEDNGGGGGGCASTGGMGGNSTSGTDRGGQGGSIVSTPTNHSLSLCGAGGAGATDGASLPNPRPDGGRSGASLGIYAGSGEINVHCVINVSGNNGNTGGSSGGDTVGGAGGGGSASEVIFYARTVNLNNSVITANGGHGNNASGSVSCGGGGASGGYIKSFAEIFSNSSIMHSVAGGKAGKGDGLCNAPFDGGDGLVKFNFMAFPAPPAPPAPNLTELAISIKNDFIIKNVQAQELWSISCLNNNTLIRNTTLYAANEQLTFNQTVDCIHGCGNDPAGNPACLDPPATRQAYIIAIVIVILSLAYIILRKHI